MDDIEAAWHELPADLPTGWFAGRPFYRDDLRVWEVARVARLIRWAVRCLRHDDRSMARPEGAV